MKNQEILTWIGIAGVAFALWKWDAYKRDVTTDAANLAKDWSNIGGDIRNAMYHYDKR